jgi:hypothetical protein
MPAAGRRVAAGGSAGTEFMDPQGSIDAGDGPIADDVDRC